MVHPEALRELVVSDLVALRELVERTTRAAAPFLVPMIDYLLSLDSDAVAQLAQSGDEE